MSNEKPTAPLSMNTASAQSYNPKMMDHDTRNAIFSFREEIHEALQLPPEDMAKIDYIEWQLNWKPVLTACVYPKKS
ncbi:hypothetical protein [Desulfovibrio intestinalis]|uniref:Uncharacterized protein n=1 Tax=Desulfovibrio intestinalis TaxID=58621 RepID=A0A7W8BYI5_9BACT|nr:hypothetical protein [Desulfovibrio intestinalis]MBB5142301.1 hypothetical protein [Desulfovibrio intestinalis]